MITKKELQDSTYIWLELSTSFSPKRSCPCIVVGVDELSFMLLTLDNFEYSVEFYFSDEVMLHRLKVTSLEEVNKYLQCRIDTLESTAKNIQKKIDTYRALTVGLEDDPSAMFDEILKDSSAD